MSDAADTVAVGTRDKKVILEFPRPFQWAAFDPSTAKQIGEAIAKEAYYLETGKHPTESVITKQIRNRLVKRTELMINNLSNKHPTYTAQQIVDTILSEVS